MTCAHRDSLDWSIRFEDQASARRIGGAAIEQLGPDDLAAVVFTSRFSKAGLPQNFTADRRLLLEAVDQPFAAPLESPWSASSIRKDSRPATATRLVSASATQIRQSR